MGKGKISRTAKKHKNNEILCDISLHLRFNGADPDLDSNLRRFEPSASARRLYPRDHSSTGKDIAHRTRYKVVPDQGPFVQQFSGSKWIGKSTQLKGSINHK